MCRGAAGVAEQIQKPFVFGQLAQQRARQTVVEEQTGVEVVREVYQQAAWAFAHFVELARGREFFILRAALLTPAHLEEYLLRRNLQHQRDHGERLLQAFLRRALLDGVGRFVFLYVHPSFLAFVHVYREVVFVQVGVVQPVTGNFLALGPAPEVFPILAQTVGEHLGTGAEFGGVGNRCAFAQEPLLGDVEAQQLALDGAVIKFVHALGA